MEDQAALRIIIESAIYFLSQKYNISPNMVVERMTTDPQGMMTKNFSDLVGVGITQAINLGY